MRSRCGHVLVGIGGVNAANAADVIRAGADGIAVVSAICAAEDPERAAGAFCRSLTNYEIRIDYVQHNISSILALHNIMKEDD